MSSPIFITAKTSLKCTENFTIYGISKKYPRIKQVTNLHQEREHKMRQGEKRPIQRTKAAYMISIKSYGDQ
jgi:hypothetical protein